MHACRAARPDRVVRQAAALLLVLLPAADVFPLAPPVVPAALRERGPGALPLRPPPRCPRTRAPAGACALAAMAAFEEGDRVEFLVKTVAFSRKIMANGMTSTGLTGASCRMSRAPTRVSTEQACFNIAQTRTGVVKYIAKPGDPDDLVMLTVAFYKDDGSEAFDHLFAEDELEKVKEEAPQTTTGLALRLPAPPSPRVCRSFGVHAACCAPSTPPAHAPILLTPTPNQQVVSPRARRADPAKRCARMSWSPRSLAQIR